jgi:hypothetical protein
MYGMGYYGTSRMASKIARMGSDPNAANRAIRTGAEIDELNSRIDKLALVVDAMWILLERAGYRKEDLESLIDELHMSDGSADGRSSPAGTKCRACGAMVEVGRPSCTFCGTEVAT